MKSRLMLSIGLLMILAVVVDAQSPRGGGGRGPRNRNRQTAATAATAPTTAPEPAGDEPTPPKMVLQPLITPDPARQAAWEYVFGDKARLDPAKVAEVRASVGQNKAGTRFWYDANNDGKIDEVWYIDVEPRNKIERFMPILVKVVPKYDLKKGDEPNRANCTYFADLNANGQVDRVLDYVDRDGDGGLDEMGMYTCNNAGQVTVWWSQNYGKNEKEAGDDRLLWYDVAYGYDQDACQVRSHFGGNESFYQMRIKPGDDHWTATFENPFNFYDRDGDGVSEEVIRVVCDAGRVRSLRWSFDAANAATPDNPRCYDVGMSAVAPGWKPGVIMNRDSDAFTLMVPREYSTPLKVNGKPTGVLLDRDRAGEWLKSITYPAGLMVWVEDGNNVAPTSPSAGERWEGVLNNEYSRRENVIFPAVGGPSSGYFNKRFDYINGPTGPFQYYFSPADQRVHLKANVTSKTANQTRTWMDVDYNFDNKSDMLYEFYDTDADGIVDKITLDVNGDGEVEDYWKLDESAVKPVEWNFASINKVFGPVIKNEPAKQYNLNIALAAALDKIKNGAGADDIWNLIENKFESPTTTGTLPAKLLGRDESILFYLRLAADRRIYALKELASEKADFLNKIEAVRAKGDTDAMTRLIQTEFGVPAPAKSCAEWIGDLRKPPVVKHVAWDDTWLPPNVGWESDSEAAYRMYYGHFDCFGKTRDLLCYPIITQPRKPGGSYHRTQDWGMDMLHVGNTCGIGGLMLWVNGKPYPVFKADTPEAPNLNPKFTWHKGPIEETNDKLVMECVVTGVGPEDAPFTMTLRPFALAGRADSPIEVTIAGGKKGDKVEVGIGLIGFAQGKAMASQTFKLDKKAGIMGLNGWQDPTIGWVNLGIVFPAKRFIRQEDAGIGPQHYVVLKYNIGETFTYSIRADWINGHRFPVAPNIDDFMIKLRETAKVAKY